MSFSTQQSDIAQMRRLYELREQRAIDAIAEQRAELKRLIGLLNEQRALVKYLQDELDLLREIRDSKSDDDLSVESLKMENERRHWLAYDMEQEIFYLPGFVSDVKEARRELARRQKEWNKLREQIAGLGRLAAERRSVERRVAARLDDALQNDRRRKEVLIHE